MTDLFERVRQLAVEQQAEIIEALLKDLPMMQLEAIQPIEARAAEMAHYYAHTRMPPALRCGWCHGRAGLLPVPATRFNPFELIQAGETVLVTGRYGVFLCAGCIRSAWETLCS